MILLAHGQPSETGVVHEFERHCRRVNIVSFYADGADHLVNLDAVREPLKHQAQFLLVGLCDASLKSAGKAKISELQRVERESITTAVERRKHVGIIGTLQCIMHATHLAEVRKHIHLLLPYGEDADKTGGLTDLYPFSRVSWVTNMRREANAIADRIDIILSRQRSVA